MSAVSMVIGMATVLFVVVVHLVVWIKDVQSERMIRSRRRERAARFDNTLGTGRICCTSVGSEFMHSGSSAEQLDDGIPYSYSPAEPLMKKP